MKLLSQVINGCAIETQNYRDVEVLGVTCDSRQVRPGYVFFAIPGNKNDGHEYIEQAVRQRCAAVIVQRALWPLPPVPVVVVKDARSTFAESCSRFYGHPSTRLNVIGVTGTSGKTTTTFLIRSILETSGERCGLVGTVYNWTGEKAFESSLTTPDSETIQRYLAEMVQNGCRSAVMEVSSHALEQMRCQGIKFAAGIFTNLSRDHLDYHKTPEAYMNAKAKLFEMLPKNGIACLNGDDPVSDVYKMRTFAQVVTYGTREGVDVRAEIHEMTIHGSRFKITFRERDSIEVTSHLIGKHNVYNMLSAVACLWAMGYDLEPLRAGVEGARYIPGRLEEVSLCQDFKIFVDYAHKPDALQNVLSALKPLTPGRLICVFGCGGDRDRGKRPLMGRVVEELSDHFIITSDNPRTEDAEAIIGEIVGGLAGKGTHEVVADRREAIYRAVMQARTGDVVVIAGKGHENYQIFKDRVVPFDDRVVAYEALKERILKAMAQDVKK